MTLALVAAAPALLARQTIAQHSKSFALASKLLDARTRDQTAVVYTWCRWVDDAVDEMADPAAAQPVLARLRGDLADAYARRATEPVLAAFGTVARERGIPIAYPTELLAGMEMDLADTRYRTVDDLLLYCWRVAGVVGLMMSHVFGVSDDDALVHAAHLGIAMQLTNICRDVDEDWQRGRVYIPDDVLARHGGDGLVAQLATRGGSLPATSVRPLGDAVRELLALADRYYRSGDRGVRALPWRAALAVRAARSVYSAIGKRIARANYDVTAGRAVVPTSAKLARVAGAAARIALSSPRRMFAKPARVPTTTLELADVTAP